MGKLSGMSRRSHTKTDGHAPPYSNTETLRGMTESLRHSTGMPQGRTPVYAPLHRGRQGTTILKLYAAPWRTLLIRSQQVPSHLFRYNLERRIAILTGLLPRPVAWLPWQSDPSNGWVQVRRSPLGTRNWILAMEVDLPQFS